MGKTLYAVMKLVTTITIKDIQGIDVHIKISGAAGCIPVFSTLKQAQKHAHNKYKIIAISEVPK